MACAAGCQAMVDSGTTEITGPPRDVNGWVGAYRQVSLDLNLINEHSFVMDICVMFFICIITEKPIYGTNVSGSANFRKYLGYISLLLYRVL